MGCVAHVAIYTIDIYCMASVAMDRRPCKQLEKIIWPYLPAHVCLECAGDLVGMECLGAGGHRGFPGQQPCNVRTMVTILFYKKEIRKVDGLLLSHYFLVDV